jgi:hypothetical protein
MTATAQVQCFLCKLLYDPWHKTVILLHTVLSVCNSLSLTLSRNYIKMGLKKIGK